MIRLTIIYLFVSLISFGQNQEKRDSLVNEICKGIVETRGQGDSARIYIAYQKHLYPFLNNFPEAEREDIGMTIYFRLQRNCVEFKEILDRLDPPKGDWESLGNKPKTKLDKNACRKLLEHKNFRYLESNGDTVKLKIEKGYWIDNFIDGTYSKLKLIWVTDCEFDIEFIESNNKLRKGFSKPGDKYRYQVVDMKSNYYEMSVEISGTNRYFGFRLYY